jgi:RNA polymerase sigma factor (sigma-70 family)
MDKETLKEPTDEIYCRYALLVLRFLRRRVPSPEDAHDIWHDTYLNYLRARDARVIQDPQGYLQAIAMRELWKFHARRKKVDVLSCSGPDALELIERIAGDASLKESGEALVLRSQIEDALRRLPYDERAAVTHCKLEGRSRKEAARLMRKSVYQVERYLAAGLTALRVLLRS